MPRGRPGLVRDVCPNCGASLSEGRCAQCSAVVVSAAEGPLEGLRVELGAIETVFAMPMASTRPQSAGHGSSWWVCASVKPTLSRVVLARGLSEEAAVRLAQALAFRVQAAP